MPSPLLAELFLTAVRGQLLIVDVDGMSMAPTIIPGDIAICSRTHPPLIGSIVIEEMRAAPSSVAYHVKRLVALNGDERHGATIPAGHGWLEGDNANGSTDSRQRGPIPLERVCGVALAVLRGPRFVDVRPRVRQPRGSRLSSAREFAIDAIRRIETRKAERSDANGVSPTAFHSYTATPWAVARRALDALDIGPADVFFDYGCGKGRMLLAAAEYPFRRLVGIECVPSLAHRAQSNTRRLADRCTVVIGNATQLELPDDVTVIYVFNPFPANALMAVASQIAHSLERHPRRLAIVSYAIERPVAVRAFGPVTRDLSDGLLVFEGAEHGEAAVGRG